MKDPHLKNYFYYYNLENFTSEMYETFYELMPEFRKIKCDKYLFLKDKIACVALYALLIKVLKELHFNLDNGLQIGEFGKPYFLNNPDLDFSCSHSGNYVCVVVGKNRVGCDVENMDRNVDITLYDKIFKNDDETLHIFDDELDPRLAFFKQWTIKECYAKALGIGLGKSLSQYSNDEDNNIKLTFSSCEFVENNHIFTFITCNENDSETINIVSL